MNNHIAKQVKILSIGFALIFFGFGSIQYYQTAYFSQAQMVEVGFWSLILIYSFFTIFSPLAGIFVSKYGAKKCMIIASLFYSFIIFAFLTKSILLVYLTSVLLGIAAAFLWTGQNSYLVRASDEKFYGANAGYFTTLTFLGGGSGVLILSFLIDKFSFEPPFLAYAFSPIIGFLSLFFLKDLRAQVGQGYLSSVRKFFASATALKLASIGFMINFVLGLTLGVIPLEVKNTLGLFYVGFFSSLFYIFPVFFSYFAGRLSDIQGRGKFITFSYFLLLIGLVSLLLSKIVFFLIFGIVLFAVTGAIIRPILSALIGDVARADNLEFVTSLFWTVQNVGVVSALVISQIFQSEVKIIYLTSLSVTLIFLLIFLPLSKLNIEEIRERIFQETH